MAFVLRVFFLYWLFICFSVFGRKSWNNWHQIWYSHRLNECCCRIECGKSSCSSSNANGNLIIDAFEKKNNIGPLGLIDNWFEKANQMKKKKHIEWNKEKCLSCLTSMVAEALHLKSKLIDCWVFSLFNSYRIRARTRIS